VGGCGSGSGIGFRGDFWAVELGFRGKSEKKSGNPKKGLFLWPCLD